MTLLLDANVLIALVNECHVHQERTRVWFGQRMARFQNIELSAIAVYRLPGFTTAPGS